MKKLLFSLLILVMLVGCSDDIGKIEQAGPEEVEKHIEEVATNDDKDNLETFISEYNKRVDLLNSQENDLPTMGKIKKENIGEIERHGSEGEYTYGQDLIESDQESIKGYFKLIVLYDKYNNIEGYEVFSMGDPKHTDEENEVYFSEKGIVSINIVADILGVKLEKYHDGIFSQGMDTFIDEESGVTIRNISDVKIGSLMVTFYNKE